MYLLAFSRKLVTSHAPEKEEEEEKSTCDIQITFELDSINEKSAAPAGNVEILNFHPSQLKRWTALSSLYRRQLQICQRHVRKVSAVTCVITEGVRAGRLLAKAGRVAEGVVH